MIAVHVGAGYHAQSKLPGYKQTCHDACKTALELLREGGTADEAVTAAVSVLENSPLTNAGLGSNLTEKGTVECDACLMTDDLKFGACGAVQGVVNPVKLAKLIHKNQSKTHALGRVPPCVLVGNGANEWAKNTDLELCDPADLKTPASTQSYNRYMTCLKKAQNGHSKMEMIEPDLDGVTDTVGAVCVDISGRLAASASSGGILLKHPGRIGPAAMYGCGCWAESAGNSGVAIAASGCGEQLMQTLLVRECARQVINCDSDPSYAVQDSFSNFISSEHLSDDRNAGLLVLYKDEDSKELLWTHSTQTMVLAYGNTHVEKLNCLVSRNEGKPGHSSVMSGVRIVTKS